MDRLARLFKNTPWETLKTLKKIQVLGKCESFSFHDLVATSPPNNPALVCGSVLSAHGFISGGDMLARVGAWSAQALGFQIRRCGPCRCQSFQGS